MQTQQKLSLPLLCFNSCVSLLCLSQNGTCSLFCGLLVVCEFMRESSGHWDPLSSGFPVLATTETALPFSWLISSKSGYPMKLPLRLQQIHHYNRGSNAFCVLLSSVRKIPLFCTNPFPYCLGINQNKGLHLCTDRQLWICIYVYHLT